MKFNFKNVYVTGGSGWLGKTLIKTLLNGDKLVLENLQVNIDKVFSLEFEKDNQPFLNNDSVELIGGDLRSENDCNNFLKNSSGGILFHCAGVIHPTSVKQFYEINLNGTKNIINSAIKNKIKKIVVISSNSPIGCNKKNNYLFTETSEYNPYMNYGNSKKLMELFLLKKINEGVDITIIRPPWFYGENMPIRQLTFYKMVKNGKFPMIGNGRNIRSKANVKNIVQGMILASIVEKSKGQIYWIADEKPYTMKEIIYTVVDVLENEFGIKCQDNKIALPFFVGELFEVADFLIQKTGLYNQKIHVASELNKNIACSIEKAKKELGYKPLISLYEGIKIALNTIDLKKEFYE